MLILDTGVTEFTPPVAMWVIGLLCSFIGAILLVLLNRVIGQGDDTNKKVTAQGEMLARLSDNVENLERRVTSLHEWRNMVQERELVRAQKELDEERRKNTERQS